MKRKLLMLLLFVVMISVIFSGCVGNNNSEGTGTDDRVFVVGVPYFNDTFDPYGSSGYPDIDFVINNTNDYLFMKDDNGNIVPALCESYDLSSDGLEYTFNIRKGVYFSNGEELKASDVKYSLEVAMEAPFTLDGFFDVEKIELVDDYTVKMQMLEINVSMIEKLTNYFAPIVNEKAHTEAGDSYGSSPETTIGTGAYILQEYKEGEYAVFEANENYFMGAPVIKKVEMKVISDADAAMIALQTGEIDAWFDDIPSISYDTLEKNSAINIANYSSARMFRLLLNNEEGIMSNKEVRKAIAYAIDREKALLIGQEGYGIVVDNPGGPDYTGQPGYGTYYNQDIEKAKRIIQEQGLEGQELTIKTYTTMPYVNIATSIQDDLSKIGLDIKIMQMERNAFIDDVLIDTQFDMAVMSYGSVTRDMDEMMTCLLTDMIGWFNYNLYANPEFDEIANKGKRELDPEKRKRIYAEAIRIYTDDAVEVPLYYPIGSTAYSNKLIVNENLLPNKRLFYFKWDD